MQFNRFKEKELSEVLLLNQSGTWGDNGDENDYPILRSSNIQDGRLTLDDIAFRKISPKKVNEYTLDNGDILITKSSGSPQLIGKSCLFMNPNGKTFLFSNFTQRLRANKKIILPEILFYYLNSPRAKDFLQKISNTTSGLRNLNMRDFAKQPIPILPISEQQKIAFILEQTDSARQKRKLANQLTEQFLQSAFLEMFGDPVKNEKEWEVEEVGDISTKVSSGSTPLGGAAVYKDSGITFIRSQNVLMNRFDYSNVAFISDEIHSNMKRTWLKKEDVLLNITGASIGRVSFFEGIDDSANVNQHVCIIRVKKNKILPVFLSFQISIPTFQSSILSQNSGATRQAFTFEQIKSFKIILPPLTEQQKFATLVEQVEKLRTKQRESERELENLFGSLMQRYFG
ncbi:MAG: restriction endonuclease subunit S [Chitinophagales bacterium]|nr:restriction endonuclease subunit S [Chitinophagales bacterium]